MNFPSADYELVFLRLSRIQTLLAKARPELGALTTVRGPRLALTIDLPASPSGAHNRVVFGRGSGHIPHWLIVGSRGHDLVHAVWDLETENNQLRDALLATYDGCLAKSEIASPWRWAEPVRSAIVRVAEGLVTCGVDVEGVVSANRLMPAPVEGASNLRWVRADFGDALRTKMHWGIGTLARKPTLGWVFDANKHDVTRRIDLARYLTGTSSASPGLATDDEGLVVQAVSRAVKEAEWDSEEGRIPHSVTADTTRPFDAVAAWWLRELGYTGVELDGSMQRVCGPLHVVATGKRCDLSTVKRAFADAAVDRKPLVMFADGYTRDASTWANQASVALFTIDSSSRIWPANKLAREHLPQVI